MIPAMLPLTQTQTPHRPKVTQPHALLRDVRVAEAETRVRHHPVAAMGADATTHGRRLVVMGVTTHEHLRLLAGVPLLPRLLLHASGVTGMPTVTGTSPGGIHPLIAVNTPLRGDASRLRAAVTTHRIGVTERARALRYRLRLPRAPDMTARGEMETGTEMQDRRRMATTADGGTTRGTTLGNGAGRSREIGTAETRGNDFHTKFRCYDARNVIYHVTLCTWLPVMPLLLSCMGLCNMAFAHGILST